MKILSPDTPPDIQPIPYAQRPVECLGLTSTQLAAFHAAGLYTLAQYDAFLAAGGKPSDFKGLGPTADAKISQSHTAQRALLEYEKMRLTPKMKVGR